MKLLMHEVLNDQVKLYACPDSIDIDVAAKSCSRIAQLLEDLSFGDSIGEAFGEVTQSCAKLREPQTMKHRRIERKIRMYLSEFSVFINHWDKKIKNSNGKNKEELIILWEDLTHAAYDTCETYMFVSHLRNYAMHGGEVVSQIQGAYNLPYVQPLCHKSFLLGNYQKWKKVDREFLSEQSEYFDLLPILQQSYLKIKEIHETMMDAQLTKQTVLDCENLMALEKTFSGLNDAEGCWDIIEFFDKEETSLSMEQISFDTLSSCERSYANWGVYSILKNRALIILDIKNNQS